MAQRHALVSCGASRTRAPATLPEREVCAAIVDQGGDDLFVVQNNQPTLRASPQSLWRGHWQIENRLHWARDVTLGEDHSHIRTGAAPQIVAALRNIAITLLRRTGWTNLSQALQTYAAQPQRLIPLLMNSRK